MPDFPAQPLPHNADAERAILGAIILDNSLVIQAAELLRPDELYVRAHQFVFVAMLSLSARGSEINPILLGEELRREGVLEQTGGVAFISELTYGLPHYTNVAAYAKVVKGKALLRQLVKVANKMTSEALEEEDDPDVIVDHAEQMIFELRAGRRGKGEGALSYAEVWERFVERQRAMASGRYAPIPFFDLPRLNGMAGGGMYEQQLITVAALTSRGKCLSASTRVLMASGEWKPVSSVREGDFLVAADTTNYRWRTDQVYAVSPGEVRPTYRITLHGGQVVVATAEHRFLSFGGWRMVSELSAGDFLAIPRRLPAPEGNALSQDDACLLALWIANGSKTIGSYKISTMSESLLKELRRIVHDHNWRINKEGDHTYALSGRNRGREIGAHEDHPLALLKRAGLFKAVTSGTVRVPQMVFRAGNGIVATFLNWLWSCDGSVSKDKLEYSSNSRDLCLDVKRLLWRFGVRARLSTKRFVYKGERRLHYRLSVDDVESVLEFEDKIGLTGKQDRLCALAAAKGRNVLWRGERVPGCVREQFKHSLKFYAQQGISVYRRGGNFMREKIERIARIDDNRPLLAQLTGDVAWERITSIEAVGEELTYDIQMTLHHNFLANGVVSHNSSFAKQVVDYNAAQGVGSIYFSREMSDIAILGRSLAALTAEDGELPVPANQIRRAYSLDEHRKNRVLRAGAVAARWPVWVETRTANVGEIYTTVRHWLARTYPEWLRRNYPDDWEAMRARFLIVVDYAQLLFGSKPRYNTKAEEYAEIWRSLKNMAQDFEGRVVALAQFNNTAYNGTRPRLSQIEGSGEAMKATNMGIVIWSEEEKIAEAQKSKLTRYPVKFYIEKQTEGPTGHVEAEYDTQTLEFYPPSIVDSGDFNNK